MLCWWWWLRSGTLLLISRDMLSLSDTNWSPPLIGSDKHLTFTARFHPSACKSQRGFHHRLPACLPASELSEPPFSSFQFLACRTVLLTSTVVMLLLCHHPFVFPRNTEQRHISMLVLYLWFTWSAADLIVPWVYFPEVVQCFQLYSQYSQPLWGSSLRAGAQFKLSANSTHAASLMFTLPVTLWWKVKLTVHFWGRCRFHIDSFSEDTLVTLPSTIVTLFCVYTVLCGIFCTSALEFRLNRFFLFLGKFLHCYNPYHRNGYL